MNIRFQADANLDPDIGFGLQRREPAIDYRLSSGIIPDALSDNEVLGLAKRDGRVLVSNDVRTMPSHFAEFIQAEDSPGLILIPSRVSIGEAIDGLLIAWLSWTPEEMRNQIRWLPR